MNNGTLTEKLQNRFIEVLEKEGKKLLQWGAILIAAAAACFYFFFSKEEKKNPSLALDTAYFALQSASKEEFQHELNAFGAMLHAHPALAPTYQGKAAQLILEKGNAHDAALLLQPVFHRVGIMNYPDFQEFSNISLIIAEGNLQEGLDRSVQLQAALENEPTLFAHNLIRIGLLQKMLGRDYQETLNKIKSLPNKEIIEAYSYKNLGLFSFFEAL